MKWEGRKESDHIEVDCLGKRSTIGDEAVQACLTEVEETLKKFDRTFGMDSGDDRVGEYHNLMQLEFIDQQDTPLRRFFGMGAQDQKFEELTGKFDVYALELAREIIRRHQGKSE